MLVKKRAYKDRSIQSLLWWFFYILLAVTALPAIAAPEPYHHNFIISSITRPIELKAFGESYEVDPAAEQLKQKAKMTEGGKAASFQVLDKPGSLTGAEEAPDQYFVEYDPAVISVNDLPGLGDMAPNIICQNQKAWFRVDREKALAYGVPENKIIAVKDDEKLLDMKPYQEMSPDWKSKGFSEKALEAYSNEVCRGGTQVLRHFSVQFGHATLELDSQGFVLTSWLKSVSATKPWQQYKWNKPAFVPKPVVPEILTSQILQAYKEQLKRFEEYETRLADYNARVKWREDHRASRSKESLILMFWPEWFEHILTEEHPQFVEKGQWVWEQSYHLTVNRAGVEHIEIDAQIRPSGIQQSIALTSFQDFRSDTKYAAVAMQPALALPYHVLSGDVKSMSRDFTYTPFARPSDDPINRKLSLHTYSAHYRPELERDDLPNSDIPLIPAVVYDFYSNEDDSHAKPENRQPRLTYWVGTEGDFEGRLLGRRIMYKTQRVKSIGCEAAPAVCKFEYPVYRGLEYRLEVSLDENRQIKRETSKVQQSDGARKKGGLTKRRQMQPQDHSTKEYLTQGLIRWYSYLNQGKQVAGAVGQAVIKEGESLTRSYLVSSLSGYVIELAFASMGVKYRPLIPMLPKILMVRILHHLNLVY